MLMKDESTSSNPNLNMVGEGIFVKENQLATSNGIESGQKNITNQTLFT